MSWPRFSSGQPTHGIGEFGATNEYARLVGDQRANAMIDPELSPIIRRAAWLLCSPLALLVAWVFGQAGIHDIIVTANGWPLALWTLVIVAVAGSQVRSKSKRLLQLRKAMLTTLLGATIGIAAGYVWAVQTAHAEARPGGAQRAFAYVAKGREMGGLIPAKYGFQLENGADLAGGEKRRRLKYGSCVTARLVTGPYGFRWVRVTEWTAPPGPGQLHWPVRREDCFSDIPLSQVRR